MVVSFHHTRKVDPQMRLRIRSEELLAFMRGSLLPRKPGPLLKARHPRVLVRVPHSTISSWILILRSSHSRKQILDWLVAKYYLGHAWGKGEILISYLLVKDDWEYSLLEDLLQKKRLIQRRNRMIGLETAFLNQARRITHGYEPSVIFAPEWQVTRIQPVRRIGVGYKDQGNLGTGLSWRDQILHVEDVTPQPDSFAYLVHLSLGKQPRSR